jgi:hypothetical protein
MQEKVIETVKDFVMEAFLPGEDPNELQADTPLITGGIEHLNTLNDVAQLVQSKL